MIKERKWMNLKYNVFQVEWNKQKEWKYQGDVGERMKGLRGTELATPFHPLYTPWGPSPGGTDRKMAHRSLCSDSSYLFVEGVYTYTDKLWARTIGFV